MGSIFEAFVTNPAQYSAGHLVGETLRFPTTTEEVQALLKRIGVDGVRCQEYFIISFDSDILGLYDYLGEYENLDELNHLAHLLEELSPLGTGNAGGGHGQRRSLRFCPGLD